MRQRRSTQDRGPDEQPAPSQPIEQPPGRHLTDEEMRRYERLLILWQNLTRYALELRQYHAWETDQQVADKLDARQVALLSALRREYPGVQPEHVSLPPYARRVLRRISLARKLLPALANREIRRLLEEDERMIRFQWKLKIEVQTAELSGLMRALRKNMDPLHRLAVATATRQYIQQDQEEPEPA
jgi:hypothetical protein